VRIFDLIRWVMIQTPHTTLIVNSGVIQNWSMVTLGSPHYTLWFWYPKDIRNPFELHFWIHFKLLYSCVYVLHIVYIHRYGGACSCICIWLSKTYICLRIEQSAHPHRRQLAELKAWLFPAKSWADRWDHVIGTRWYEDSMGNHSWLVVWNIFLFHIYHILGMSSPQLTNSIIFQRGRYTANQIRWDFFMGIFSGDTQHASWEIMDWGWIETYRNLSKSISDLRGWTSICYCGVNGRLPILLVTCCDPSPLISAGDVLAHRSRSTFSTGPYLEHTLSHF